MTLWSGAAAEVVRQGRLGRAEGQSRPRVSLEARPNLPYSLNTGSKEADPLPSLPRRENTHRIRDRDWKDGS